MNVRTWSWLAALSVVVGCASPTAEPAPERPSAVLTGSLVLDWSIAGSKDAARCADTRAAVLRVTVYFGSGAIAGNFEQACAAFATRVALAEGAYTATAVLLDAGGAVRTIVVPVAPFTIHAREEVDATVDFAPTYFR